MGGLEVLVVELLGSVGFPVLRLMLVVVSLHAGRMVLAGEVQMLLMSHYPVMPAGRHMGMGDAVMGNGSMVFGQRRGKRRSGDKAEGAGGCDRKCSETGFHDGNLP